MPNQYTIPRRFVIRVIGPSIAYLPCTQGKFSLIDSEQADFLEQWNWTACLDPKGNCWYVTRKGKSLHRCVAGMDGLKVDHINGNTLDNRAANLRAVTHSQNMMNRKVSANSLSGVPGVRKRKNTWEARISTSSGKFYLGRFATVEEATTARVAAEIKYFGEFRRDNATRL